MNVSKVLSELQEKYPRTNIVQNDSQNPTEIICEVDPTSNHPDKSIAIAVIDKSLPHYHKVTTETDEVLKGELTLIVNSEKHLLKVGDTFTIKPSNTHYAEGNETWVKVTSNPGWTMEDHILVKQSGKNDLKTT